MRERERERDKGNRIKGKERVRGKEQQNRGENTPN